MFCNDSDDGLLYTCLITNIRFYCIFNEYSEKKTSYIYILYIIAEKCPKNNEEKNEI